MKPDLESNSLEEMVQLEEVQNSDLVSVNQSVYFMSPSRVGCALSMAAVSMPTLYMVYKMGERFLAGACSVSDAYYACTLGTVAAVGAALQGLQLITDEYVKGSNKAARKIIAEADSSPQPIGIPETTS